MILPGSLKIGLRFKVLIPFFCLLRFGVPLKTTTSVFSEANHSICRPREFVTSEHHTSTMSAEIAEQEKRCRRIVCYFSLPTKGTLYGMTHAKAMKTSGPRRHSPPSNPTRKRSYQIWEFPVSALTLGLSGIYTFRVTSRNVDQP
ncbi:hypothetical protein AVEN_22482-1 [Araneus ventricosus]|uniref:Fibronectin type-III domain-containing protein n=1 Tax=Araneus ventricosus TaxID=182803 RepID=A0A4Y2NZH8_ARAVE|nr:hypothetical protein AVEN_22482-1 [Araneus ventricosus]